MKQQEKTVFNTGIDEEALPSFPNFPTFPSFFASHPTPPTTTSSWPLYHTSFSPAPIHDGDYPAEVSDAEQQEQPMTIPIGHLTTTGSLFSVDQIRSLIGEYPEDFFFQIEATHTIEQQTPPSHEKIANILATMDSSQAAAVLENFFAEIHPHFPILDQASFTATFNSIVAGTGNDIDAALCLIILALGELAGSLHTPAPGTTEQDEPGREHFSIAYHIITTSWLNSFDLSTSLVTALVYAAIYLCYMSRPLQAWRLIHMASTKLQMIVSQ